jgi:hypothetical protein
VKKRHSNRIPTRDGYTEPGFIAARVGLFDEDFRFKFRPLLVQEQSKWMKESGGIKDSERDRKIAQLMSERIVEWDLADDDGKMVPISVAECLTIKPALFSQIFGIILGTDPSDVDPKWNDGVKDEALEIQSEVATSGGNVGSVREGNNEKNFG